MPGRTDPPADRSGAAKLGPAQGLIAQVYEELRALAVVRMRQESAGHTLQPTALVHEVYLKLAEQTRAAWHSRTHFFATAAEALRRILVDHARKRNAAKRAAPGPRVTIHAELDATNSEQSDVLELDDALTRLAELSPRQARVVELRFFGGLEVSEVAQVLEISETTVKSEWRLARAWLQRELDARSGA